jgi:uncharacterized protein (DUF697 family)
MNMASTGTSRKKLPKAIQRPAVKADAPAAGLDVTQQREALARWVDEPAKSTSTALQPAPARVVAEPIAATALPAVVAPAGLPPAVVAPAAAPLAVVDAETAQRRSQARAIVDRHAAYSLAGGLIPVPIANVAGVTAIIVRMVMSLSKLYRVPFERDRARAMVVGLMGGAMPTGLAAVTASTLGYVVPGSNLIGLAVCSMTSAACTRSIGRVFVEHFENVRAIAAA